MPSKRITAAVCAMLVVVTGCDLSAISRRGSVQQAERERLEASGTAAAWLAASTLGAQQLGGWDLPTNEDDEPEMPGGENTDALGGDGSGDDSGDNSGSGGALTVPELPSVEVRNEFTGSGRGERRGLGLRRLLGR